MKNLILSVVILAGAAVAAYAADCCKAGASCCKVQKPCCAAKK